MWTKRTEAAIRDLRVDLVTYAGLAPIPLAVLGEVCDSVLTDAFEPDDELSGGGAVSVGAAGGGASALASFPKLCVQ